MKPLLIFSLIIYTPFLSYAQENRLDQIFKRDHSIIKATSVEIMDSLLHYKIIDAGSDSLFTLNTNEVIAIVFSSGEFQVLNEVEAVFILHLIKLPLIENLKPLAIKQQENQKTGLDRIFDTSFSSNKTIVTAPKVKPYKMRRRPRTTFGIGGDLSSMISSDRWVNETAGNGFGQGTGGSLRLQINPGNYVGITITAGYSQWIVRRVFNEDQNITTTLRVIPASLGLKIYPLKRLYIEGEGSVNAFNTQIQPNGIETVDAVHSGTDIAIGYGGSIGYEFLLGKFIFDLSPRYQIIKGTEPSSDASFAALRLTIGIPLSRR